METSHLRFGANLCGCVLALVLAVGGGGCGPRREAPEAPPPGSTRDRPESSGSLLIPEPDVVALGRLEPGTEALAAMVLRNPTTDQLELIRIETSCPCIRIAPAQVAIPPGEEALLEVSFDPAADPDFLGDLAVQVIGYSPEGRPLFRGAVTVSIGGDDDPGGGESPG